MFYTDAILQFTFFGFFLVILDKLPGLDFLKTEPEYQQRYS
jgi:hypothetical protein